MKIAIYTALTGGYDNLIQPRVIDKDISYICFSNDIKKESVGVWRILPIPNIVDNAQRLSRYPKMKPYLLLEDFDYSLYIDANIEIVDDTIYKRIKELAAEGVELAGMWHHEVDCIYEEGLRVVTSKRERNWRAVVHLMRFIKREGMPYHWGMYEANCIFRNNHSEKVKKQGELWWDCFMNYAQRDQLSFTYTLWKSGLELTYILPIGYNTRNHPGIVAGGHGPVSAKWKKTLKSIFYRPTVELLKCWITISKNVS